VKMGGLGCPFFLYGVDIIIKYVIVILGTDKEVQYVH